MELCALALAEEKWCCQWNRSFGGGTKHKPNQVFNLKNYFLFCKLLDNLVLFSEMFLTNDKACTTYTFFFIAKKITTLKILQVFPSLTKQQKSQCWGELTFTYVWPPNLVLYILWTEPEWHQFLRTYIAIIKSRNVNMLYGLLLLLSCSGDWTWSWCNPMTAFFVSNYIVMKDNDLNYFPCFEEKIFSFILRFCFVFVVLGKKNSIVHFISLIVVFFTEKILWLKLFHVSL